MKALSRWTRLNVVWQNYREFLSKKPDRYDVTYTDLLFIRNFKAGNSSITENAKDADQKLLAYSDSLRRIRRDFPKAHLASLEPSSLPSLIRHGEAFLSLARGKSSYINGFGASYASALLSAMFPNLYPILDRRVLFGTHIVEVQRGQRIANIHKYYGELIRFFYDKLLADSTIDIRILDRHLFSVAMPGE